MDKQKAEMIEELIEKEQYKEALDAIKLIPEADIDDPTIFNGAICKISLEDIDGAIKDLMVMVRNGSAFPYTDYVLGQLYEKKGDNAKAQFYYKHGMRHKETFEDAKKAYDYLYQQREIDEESAKIIELKPFKSTTTFKDVIGLDAIKRKLYVKVILPLRKPELYTEYGRDLSSGIILDGPSGSGKTLLARAIAGESDSYMIVVKIHQVEGEFVGVTEKNVHQLFEQARVNAPCIIFIDEFEVLGGKRSAYSGSDEHGGTSVLKQAVNALLEEMDGIEKNPEGIMLITATNRPWDIDPALKRPGRLENSIYVPAPTYIERFASFKFRLAARKVSKDINMARLARATDGFTQADIRKICNDAAEIPILEKFEKGIDKPIRMADLLKTIRNAKPSLNAWYMQARKELIGRYDTQMVQRQASLHMEVSRPRTAGNGRLQGDD